MHTLKEISKNPNLQNAKITIRDEIQELDGFTGIGLGVDDIRVYVKSNQSSVVKYLQEKYGETYEGFSISIIVTGEIKAF